MPTPVAERDLSRARDLRKQAKDIKDPMARDRFLSAADRLERRAGQSAAKLGRPSKPRPARPIR